MSICQANLRESVRHAYIFGRNTCSIAPIRYGPGDVSTFVYGKRHFRSNFGFKHFKTVSTKKIFENFVSSMTLNFVLIELVRLQHKSVCRDEMRYC